MRLTAVLAGILFSVAACAQDSADALYRAGEHYEVLPEPVRTITGDKIEVTEVFSYGCGHCFTIEPMLNSWAQTLPEDAELVKSPAVFRSNMETYARIFYTAQALGVLDQVHGQVFDAIHRRGQRMMGADEIAPVFAAAGVEREKFDKVFNSFTVTSQVNQAAARTRGFRITGTPEMVVDGRFRISTRMAGSQQEMLEVSAWLVEQIQQGAL